MNWLTNIPVSARDKERTLEAKSLQEEHVKNTALREEAKIALREEENSREEQKPKCTDYSSTQPNYALEIAIFGAPIGLFKM